MSCYHWQLLQQQQQLQLQLQQLLQYRMMKDRCELLQQFRSSLFFNLPRHHRHHRSPCQRQPWMPRLVASRRSNTRKCLGISASGKWLKQKQTQMNVWTKVESLYNYLYNFDLNIVSNLKCKCNVNVNNKFVERTGSRVSSALGCRLQYCANRNVFNWRLK